MAAARPAGTRETILNACLDLLQSAGAGARMADIARAAGVSRQAVYLHFPTRAELLIETARHADQVFDIDARLAESRAAQTGEARLDAFIAAWGGFVADMHPIMRAILAMKDTDPDAAAAWEDRMKALRHGCRAAVDALARDGRLTPALGEGQAVDTLWTLMSVRNYEHWVLDCGWTKQAYAAELARVARAALVRA